MTGAHHIINGGHQLLFEGLELIPGGHQLLWETSS